MPWDIKQRNGVFCVVKKGTEEAVPGGCHDTEGAAKAHMRALYANEPSSVTAAAEREGDTLTISVDLGVRPDEARVAGDTLVGGRDVDEEIVFFDNNSLLSRSHANTVVTVVREPEDPKPVQEDRMPETIDSLVAAVGAPATAFLPEEQLPGPTPWGLQPDGVTVDGHLALWASCHIGYPGCVKPPQEETFDFFNLGEAVTADGRSVPVGKVTIGTGHAGPDLSWRTAAAHYDESGTGVSVVHAMRDKWGIRLPGALVADVEGAKVDELRRSPLSGDWRKINGRLRLVAALGVNVPGYPIPRALVAAGEVTTMFLGFNPEDAAEVVLEADMLAASLGLDPASRAAALREALLKS
jgi:hypothetical protein